MSKTSGTIDLKSIKEASSIATSYVTDITNNGVFIHPNGNNTDGIQIQDTISIIRDGDVVADYGENIILGNKGNAQSPNENLLYLSKSSISLRGGNYNAIAKDRVFEVSESMNSIVIETSSNTKQYTNSKIGNIKTISEVAINHTPLAENEYTINKQQNKITLVNYPSNGVLIITYIPNYLDEVITFSTDSESEYERKTFLMPDNTSLILSVLLNNTQLVENTDYTYDSSKLLIHLTSDPSTGKTLTVNYRRESRYFYTLGKRNMEQIGDYSVITGENCMATGYASFAGGQNTYVSGKNSFGFGYGEDNLDCVKVTGQNSGAIGTALNVSGHGSFVCGRYNVDNYNLRFAVGNGTGVGARNNIFAAGNYGVYINGSLYSGMIGTSNTPRKMFTTGTAVSDNISISANNVSGAKTVSVAKTGYTPIGIVGYEIGNASTSGTNASPCFPYIMRINGSNISFNIRNNSSSASKIKITFYVYYIATAAL